MSIYWQGEEYENITNKVIPFIIALKRIKYLGKHLTKVQDRHVPQNYKTLLKELKDLNKWKDTPCLWFRRPNIVKMAATPKLI